MRIGKLLIAYRQKNDITLINLEKEIGFSKATISRIERGEECDIKTLMRLLNWLTSEDQS